MMQNKDSEAEWAKLRALMVQEQLGGREIQDPRVLAAMSAVPRHEFVPESIRKWAYEDCPLSIGYDQTISQPFIVAFMTGQLALNPTDRVLEIGTGSGYQAAVLSLLASEVYTVETLEPLAQQAAERLDRLGFRNVHTRLGDGFAGWPEQAPFNAIIVTCAPTSIPQALLDQLKEGGRMILPVGPQGGPQELLLLEKHGPSLEQRPVLPVRFVPMIKPQSSQNPQ